MTIHRETMPAAFFRRASETQREMALRLVTCSDTLLLWLARYRDRRRLDAMSDHQLKDMGISRLDADREAAKYFWRG